MKDVNLIVAAGSSDGILTTAALLRYIGAKDVEVIFTQSFQVDQLDLSSWKANRKVAFVDLAVNNKGAEMTEDFVRQVKASGHEIVAVCDEHDHEAWLKVLGTFEGLLIEPQSQAGGTYTSSGHILMDACSLDEHGRALCEAADAADRMEFKGLGALVNSAVKSAITDNTRRVYLARHLAQQAEPDETIQGWMDEYDAILKNHEEIIAERQDLGNGIIRISTVGKTVDITTLMRQMYKEGAEVAVVEGEFFDRTAGKKTVQVSFGTGERKRDLLATIKPQVAEASGFAQKVNVPLEKEESALEAVRSIL